MILVAHIVFRIMNEVYWTEIVEYSTVFFGIFDWGLATLKITTIRSQQSYTVWQHNKNKVFCVLQLSSLIHKTRLL